MKDKKLVFGEFIALMALMTSMTALAVDGILPALSEVGKDLAVAHINDTHLIVSTIFLGMGIGQLMFGPYSDQVGRKPTIAVGLCVFIIGCLVSSLSTTFSTMILGRLLQGIGLGAPRVVSIALIRDLYQGAAMARVMSFIMTIFILVPMLAPALCQLVLFVADWRAIFYLFLILGIIVLLWFMARQPETLGDDKRVVLTTASVRSATAIVMGSRVAVGYALVSGFVLGAFIVYLSSVQQMLAIQYGMGDWFPLVFAGLSVPIGAASMANTSMVMRFGMVRLVKWSLWGALILSLLFFVVAYGYLGNPPLLIFMPYLAVVLFFIGVLFGNVSSIAMEPLGKVAGIGSTIVNTISTFLSVLLGVVIARAYDNSVLPLVFGFAVCSLASLLIIVWVESKEAGAIS